MPECKEKRFCAHGNITSPCGMCERDAMIIELSDHVVTRDQTIRKLKKIIKHMYGLVDNAELYHDLLDDYTEEEARALMNEIKEML